MVEIPHATREYVGLVPAAGSARRLPPLPCSKEIYPVGFSPESGGESSQPRVAVDALLRGMRLGGARRAYIVLRPEKWDIPRYLNDGRSFGLPLAYLMADGSHGVPFTLDQAYPFVARSGIVFGFPDILFKPADAFVRLISRQEESGADVVLGLYPAHQPHKMDMVELDDEGRVRRIEIKPERTDLQFTWILAVWSPGFTRFLHEYVAALGRRRPLREEIHVGDVLQAALDGGRMQVEAVLFPDGEYLDIGTPEDLGRSGRYVYEEEVRL